MLASATTDCVDLMLREELLTRARNDRQARHAYALGTVSSSAVDQVDADNLAFLTRQLGRHGWLGADLVGEHGADACWRLVQRAPVEQQLEWLPLMQAAVFEGWAEEREVTGAGVEGPRTESTLRDDHPARLLPLATPECLSETRAMVDALCTRPDEWAKAHGYQVIAHVRRDSGGARLAAWWTDASSVRLFVTTLLRDLTKSRSNERRRCWCEVWMPDETGDYLDSATLNPNTAAIEWEFDTIGTPEPS